MKRTTDVVVWAILLLMIILYTSSVDTSSSPLFAFAFCNPKIHSFLLQQFQHMRTTTRTQENQQKRRRGGGFVHVERFARKKNRRKNTSGGGSSTSSSTTTMSNSSSSRRRHPAGRIVSEVEYITLDPNLDGSDVAWRTSNVIDILRRGGCGVLPTDTGYGFVTSLHSKIGLERILRIKQQQQQQQEQEQEQQEGSNNNNINNNNKTQKKPLSLLCYDFRTIDMYCYGIDKRIFKLFKDYLPGPYTFILHASSTNLPKMIFLNNDGKVTNWNRRKTLGIRMPDDVVLRFIQGELDGIPLLVSSIPNNNNDDDNNDFLDYEEDDNKNNKNEEASSSSSLPSTSSTSTTSTSSSLLLNDASWYNDVDFIVDAGDRPIDGSTIYDLTTLENGPELIRQGIGMVI